MANSSADAPYFQVSFFTKDVRYLNSLPSDVINVPADVEPEQLNILINSITNKDDTIALPVKFDFLIQSVLLRTSLNNFIETYKISLEEVLSIECIQQEPIPKPYLDFEDDDWVADLKTLSTGCIISVNYGGKCIVWEGSDKLEKKWVRKLDDDPLKCMDILKKDNDTYILVGTQSQTIVLLKLDLECLPDYQIMFRGHERSVECLAVNLQGTRLVSGSFDKCLKIWNLEGVENAFDSSEQNHVKITDEKESKKSRTSIATRTPMVTLESHREAIVGVCWSTLEASQVVTVSWDHQLIAWDLELAGPTSILSSNKAFTSLAMNRNGTIVTGSTDPYIRMWDLRSKEGSMVKNTYFGHVGWVSDISWCPDDDSHFVSSSFDKTVKMWDIRSPKAALYDLMGHEDRVLCVDWTHPERICSGSVDCTIKSFTRT